MLSELGFSFFLSCSSLDWTDLIPVLLDFPYALARIPAAGESRGNLAAGGRGVARELSPRDREIAAAVGPELRARGLAFVGLDVIGDYLTEVNVTCPTCIRALDDQCGLDIAGDFMDLVLRRVEAASA